MHWWWVPIVGPCVGAVAGAITYITLIELHHSPEEPPLAEMMETYGMFDHRPSSRVYDLM